VIDALNFERVAVFKDRLAAAPRSLAVDSAGQALVLSLQASESQRMAVLRWNQAGDWEELLEVDWSDADSRVQLLPDCRVLLVSPVSRRRPDGSGEPNAAVFRSGGEEAVRFSVGDGIDDIQTTAAGEIWASYTFEGSMGDYGRHGWGRIDPQLWIDPIGTDGVLRFSLDGSVTFRYSAPEGFGPVMDCYALNVAEEETWASYHPGFPLVRILSDGRVEAWRSGIWGIDAVAVAGSRFVAHRLAASGAAWVRGSLGPGGSAVDVERVEARLDPGAGEPIETVVGRGSTMHVFTSSAWYRLDVSQIR
jgi:hypothetical protein